VATGSVPEDDLDAYVRAAADGVEADRASGGGSLVYYLGRTGQQSFVALSLWREWADIEAATGASPGRPISTQRAHRLTTFHAAHYELLPELHRRPAG
jgi:hypothetical protein